MRVGEWGGFECPVLATNISVFNVKGHKGCPSGEGKGSLTPRKAWLDVFCTSRLRN